MAEGPHPTSPGSPETGPTRTPWQRVGAYGLLLGLGFAVFALDQLTKWWIATRLPYGTYGELTGAIPVIRGFCYLVHQGNTGAAWSMFSGQSLLLAVLAAATLAGIFFWRKALGLERRPEQVCFGLLSGGILGNLTDRLLHGHVIDFIDLHFGTYVYPTFNVADSGICVGVGLYLIQSLRAPQ